jgi:hypothetical protein
MEEGRFTAEDEDDTAGDELPPLQFAINPFKTFTRRNAGPKVGRWVKETSR